MKPVPGTMMWAKLPKRMPPGHEQQGLRPILVVGVPSRLGSPRFPLLLVVPVTTYREQEWADAAPRLYPKIQTGAGNLPRTSIVLLDQLQAIDSRRIQGLLGQLNTDEYARIQESLTRMFLD